MTLFKVDLGSGPLCEEEGQSWLESSTQLHQNVKDAEQRISKFEKLLAEGLIKVRPGTCELLVEGPDGLEVEEIFRRLRQVQ